MDKREVKKLVREQILGGKTKEETFNNLFERSGLPADDLAKIICVFPSREAKERVKVPNIILAVLLGITALTKVMAVFSIGEGPLFMFLLFAPIINIVLLLAVLAHSSGIHKGTAILGIISLFRIITQLKGADPLIFIDVLFILAIIALGFYLDSQLRSDYHIAYKNFTNEDGTVETKEVVEFDD